MKVSKKIKWLRAILYTFYVLFIANNAVFTFYWFHRGNGPAATGYACAALWCACTLFYIVWSDRRNDRDRKRIEQLGEALDAIDGVRKCAEYAAGKVREAM